MKKTEIVLCPNCKKEMEYQNPDLNIYETEFKVQLLMLHLKGCKVFHCEPCDEIEFIEEN